MKKIICLLITLVIGFIVYYLTLPALNLNNIGFYIFVAFILFTYAMLEMMTTSVIKIEKKGIKRVGEVPKTITYVFTGIVLMFLGILITNIICSPLFNNFIKLLISYGAQSSFLSVYTSVTYALSAKFKALAKSSLNSSTRENV